MLRARLAPILFCLAALAPTQADALDLSAASRLRSDRDEDISRSRSATWRAAKASLGRSWIAWDEITKTPHRIVLADHAAPGVIASADAAAEHAIDLLGKHVATLAPGSTASDFVLVTNDLSADIRTVAFVQHHGGVPVIGGQLSFTYKHDRLLVIANEALPFVAVPARSGVVDHEVARERARGWIAGELGASKLAVGAAEPTEILPMFGRDGVRYREVVRVPVDVDAPLSRWSVWLDARSGEPIARRQELMFEIGGVVYRVPVRHPGAEYANYGAAFVDVTVDQVDLVTDAGGAFNYQTAPGVAINTPVGPFVELVNSAGEVATQQFQVIPGNGAIWTAPDDGELEAQLAAFVHASEAKSYVRAIAPDLGWLDNQLTVTVNINDQCNAFSDGDSLNFYLASESCENTGRIADVVYHEFGHSVHQQSILPGVGLFDTALSEGVADYLAMTMIGESGMGRGFFYDDTPLRELDPEGFEYRWPDDRGEVHDEGRIIAGALWDLRKQLVAKWGEPTGVAISDHIYYESTRRAVDIPSMYLAALVVDDDNGTLADGTPNGCEINAAYGPHGLFSAGEAAEKVTAASNPDGIRVELQLALPSFPACPVGASPTLSWRLRDVASNVAEGVMTNENGVWVGTIPPQVAGSVVQYQVHVNYDNGNPRSLPDNFVDPWYELFVGDTIPLYCTGFSDLPFGTSNEFGYGFPVGGSGNRDPVGSFDDDGVVLGTAVNEYGLYGPWSSSSADSPAIATQGYTNVRLQYQRWLSVEDGFFDQAWITVDGNNVWQNYRSDAEELATFHHVDREWRFHDIDISSYASDGQVALSFQLASDGGLELGGWNLDSFCVVAFDPDAIVCGNGVLETGEACDDGNVVAGDGCSDACTLEENPGTGGTGMPGDDSGSSDESGDSGDEPGLDGDGLIDRGCGCNDGGNARAPLLLVLVLLGYRRQRGATRRRLPSCDSGTSGAPVSSRSQS